MAPKSNVALCVNHIARRLMNLEISEDQSGFKKFMTTLFGRKEE
jgi:hypothetical protein